MFDTLISEAPMPGEPKPKHLDFQTKTFDRLMDTYTIRADGTLWIKGWESLDRRLVQFHGLLRFYTLEDDLWFEYEAKFTDGKLEGIEVVEIHRTNFGKPRTIIHKRAALVLT